VLEVLAVVMLTAQLVLILFFHPLLVTVVAMETLLMRPHQDQPTKAVMAGLVAEALKLVAQVAIPHLDKDMQVELALHQVKIPQVVVAELVL
jgi:hypothetical protein